MNNDNELVHDFYSYKATCIKVYDGDTITCNIDCGFKVYLNKTKIRLYGINTPEVRGEEKEKGLISRDRLREKILDKDIVIKTIKDKSGKYGRYLGIIYFDGLNINDWLVEEGLAVNAEY
jgi:micrococcal nuclease